MATRRRFVSLAFVSLAGAAGAFACSTFTSDDPVALEPDAALVPDTSSLPADGATNDAEDGAVPRRFCAEHADAALCADFDGPDEPVSFHFIAGRGDVSLDRTAFRSPPQAMTAVGSLVDAFLQSPELTGEAFAKKQRLTYDVLLKAAPSFDAGDPGSAVLSTIHDAATGCSIAIETFGKAARLDVTFQKNGGSAYENFSLTAYPPPGQWAHVDLLLAQESGGLFVTVVVDSVTALKHQQIQCAKLGSTPALTIGLQNGVVSNRVVERAAFDNVLFDAK